MKKQTAVPSMEAAQMNLRFDGFRLTPMLWKDRLAGLKMFVAGESGTIAYPKIDARSHIRLGKLIEQFIFCEMEQDEAIQILSSNIQVFHGQTTIGELDCLIQQAAVNIHLEIVYKFYLYDPSISEELDRWIGPNRNDSLVHKLRKLKEKQLPLLHRRETAKLLQELKVKPADFRQQVYFKAQLFVPLDFLDTSCKFINKDCIIGFYICQADLGLFTQHTFYIPPKLDWLVAPHLDVEWISASTFQGVIADQLAAQRSPLCWMQSPEGKLHKFFVVWWK